MTRPVQQGITLAFGATPYPLTIKNPDGTTFGQKHHGTDFGCPEGTDVKAAEDGKVIFSGNAGTAGNMIQVQSPTGAWRYLHNSVLYTAVGQQIKAGTVISKSGNTGGYTTGPHLHVDLAINGKYVDPMLYINGAAIMVEGEAQNDLLFLTALGRHPGGNEVGRYIGKKYEDALRDLLKNSDRVNKVDPAIREAYNPNPEVKVLPPGKYKVN